LPIGYYYSSQVNLYVPCEPGQIIREVTNLIEISNVTPKNFNSGEKISLEVSITEILNDINPLSKVSQMFVVNFENENTFLTITSAQCTTITVASDSKGLKPGEYSLVLVDGRGNKIISYA